MSVDQLDELIERLNDGDPVAAERAFLAYEPTCAWPFAGSSLDHFDPSSTPWISSNRCGRTSSVGSARLAGGSPIDPTFAPS